MIALGKMGGDAAIGQLVLALADSEASVRWRACMSLAMLAPPQALAALMQLEEKEADPQVIEHLQRALARLGVRSVP